VSALRAIASREFASFFRSPIGWVIMALYLVLSGIWVSFDTIRPGEPASLRLFFATSQWLLLIVAPAISMRLISEETRAGTIEPLMTSPASDWAIAFGKYAGALAFLLVLLTPTLLYVALLAVISTPDAGPIIAGYLGLVCLGTLYLAVGLLASALTRNQVVAFLATLFFFLLLWFATTQGAVLLGPPFDKPLYALSVTLRTADFAKGVIDTEHLVFFIAASVWFVSLAALSLEWRRWR
jgi:ABC-2 type transport system permease protein